MESLELVELLSPEGLRLLDSLPAYSSTDDVVRSVAELRKAGHGPGLVAAVLNQAKLRARARAKFGPFADRMLFTEAGLEQATRLAVAAQHAGRFQRAGVSWVADLGCGIGADALAIAALDIEVTGVERDEVTAAVASFNLAPWSNARIEHADVTEFDLSGIDAVYLDPARRTPVEAAEQSGRLVAVARLRVRAGRALPDRDQARLPASTANCFRTDAEAQWVSVGREVVEVGAWFGALARPGIRRAALVIGDGVTDELTAAGDSEDAELGTLGEYVYEPDGAVIRARLIGDLARSLDGRMLDRSIAYFTTDAAVATPFAAGFRVVESFPFDEKLLKKELSATQDRHARDQEAGHGCRSRPVAHQAELKGGGVGDAHPHAGRRKASRSPRRATLAISLRLPGRTAPRSGAS